MVDLKNNNKETPPTDDLELIVCKIAFKKMERDHSLAQGVARLLAPFILAASFYAILPTAEGADVANLTKIEQTQSSRPAFQMVAGGLMLAGGLWAAPLLGEGFSAHRKIKHLESQANMAFSRIQKYQPSRKNSP